MPVPREVIDKQIDASSEKQIAVPLLIPGGMFRGALRRSQTHEDLYEFMMALPPSTPGGSPHLLAIELSPDAILGIGKAVEEEMQAPQIFTPGGRH